MAILSVSSSSETKKMREMRKQPMNPIDEWFSANCRQFLDDFTLIALEYLKVVAVGSYVGDRTSFVAGAQFYSAHAAGQLAHEVLQYEDATLSQRCCAMSYLVA